LCLRSLSSVRIGGGNYGEQVGEGDA